MRGQGEKRGCRVNGAHDLAAASRDRMTEARDRGWYGARACGLIPFWVELETDGGRRRPAADGRRRRRRPEATSAVGRRLAQLTMG